MSQTLRDTAWAVCIAAITAVLLITFIRDALDPTAGPVLPTFETLR